MSDVLPMVHRWIGTRRNPQTWINFVAALGFYTLIAAVFFSFGQFESPILHTILDTSISISSLMLALLLWDLGRRTGADLPRLLAITFTIASGFELVHTAVALEGFASVFRSAPSEIYWRTGCWGAVACLIPLALLMSMVVPRSKHHAWIFTIGLLAAGVALFCIFQWMPRYTAPGMLGTTRPSLLPSPVLWILVGVAYGYRRDGDPVLGTIPALAVLMVLANTAQTYSASPNDAAAMVAHFGKLIAEIFLLFNLIQLGSAELARRLSFERRLRRYNEDLEQRVSVRTAELEHANTQLAAALEFHKDADRSLEAKRNRLYLLHQITRAIGERQDLDSIFHVVSQSLEDKLPVDFSCGYLFDNVSQVFARTSIGSRSSARLPGVMFDELRTISLNGDEFFQCVTGKLTHQPDIVASTSPFSLQLEKSGLRALVIAPLKVDDVVFGILIVARTSPGSFNNEDCEFLAQLSEHVALAARQAKLHGNLQQAYEDLRSTREAAMQQERLRALGQMSSGIAHDINNAVSPLSLYTQSLLETGRELPLHVRSYLETVSRVVDDVSATLSRMREFYRGREPNASLSPVDLNEIVQQVVDLTRARWRDIPLQRGVVIRLHVKLDPILPPIMGAAGEIRDALTNLIFNAVDAMQCGGDLTLCTTVGNELSPPVGAVHLDVIDTGVGMDETTRRRCMEPFFTTKGERGTGLGLAMVYGVMERHAAGLEIDSTPGAGTRVHVTFAASNIPVISGQRTIRLIAAPLRILAIDDDPFVLDSLVTVLGLEGHTLVSANGGSDGVEAFRESAQKGMPFDIVITDLGMPYVDGAQVVQAIKNISSATPVILLTGWGARAADEAQDMPCADIVLEKPPDLDALRDALARCIRSSKLI
jgi:signal transduction histidine kinase/ActR/RegA family two-component response regulator